jgi:hypothetical protein
MSGHLEMKCLACWMKVCVTLKFRGQSAAKIRFIDKASLLFNPCDINQKESHTDIAFWITWLNLQSIRLSTPLPHKVVDKPWLYKRFPTKDALIEVINAECQSALYLFADVMHLQI